MADDPHAESLAHYQRALGLVGEGRVDDAIASYEAAIALRPDHAKALVNLAALYNEREQHDRAAELIDRAGSLVEGDDPVFLVNRAATRRHVGQLAEAIADARRAVEVAPELAETWIELGRSVGSAQRHAEAREAYERALAIDPSHMGVSHNYAATLDILGASAAALPFAVRAFASDPDNVQYMQTLACCYLHVDRADDAMPLLVEIERERPDHFESQYNLACGLARTGGGERALPHLRRAVELVPPRQRPHFLAHIPDDTDLVSLRDLEGFRELLAGR